MIPLKNVTNFTGTPKFVKKAFMSNSVFKVSVPDLPTKSVRFDEASNAKLTASEFNTTGRKKIALTTPRPLKLPFSITATNKLKIVITAVLTIVFQAVVANPTGKSTLLAVNA